MRLGLTLAAIGFTCIAIGQTKAPPPNAKDVPVPPRPAIPARRLSITWLSKER